MMRMKPFESRMEVDWDVWYDPLEEAEVGARLLVVVGFRGDLMYAGTVVVRMLNTNLQYLQWWKFAGAGWHDEVGAGEVLIPEAA